MSRFLRDSMEVRPFSDEKGGIEGGGGRSRRDRKKMHALRDEI
ncbi:MAG: hypothetical protein AAGA68_23045 [Pseudomonadota bacterium]